MNLVIDIGNTFVKAALFAENSLSDCVHCRCGESETLQTFLKDVNPDACAVSCVAGEMPKIDCWLKKLTCPVLRVTGATPLPFRNAYRTPQTLGSDRIAAVAGAQILCPGKDVLVADIGTCLTLDVIDAGGTFLGGNISPGPSMRFFALHEGTARLPLIEQKGDSPLVGYNTETAIRSGVLRGIALEIEGYAQMLRREKPELVLMVTGGKGASIQTFLDPNTPVVYEPHLVEIGLNAILNHNLNTSSALKAD